MGSKPHYDSRTLINATQLSIGSVQEYVDWNGFVVANILSLTLMHIPQLSMMYHDPIYVMVHILARNETIHPPTHLILAHSSHRLTSQAFNQPYPTPLFHIPLHQKHRLS